MGALVPEPSRSTSMEHVPAFMKLLKPLVLEAEQESLPQIQLATAPCLASTVVVSPIG